MRVGKLFDLIGEVELWSFGVKMWLFFWLLCVYGVRL